MNVDYSSIISKSDDEVNLTKNNIDNFVEQCFKNLVDEYESRDKKIENNYMSMANHVGEVFERSFEHLIESEYSVDVERGVSLSDANMTGSGKADAVFYVNDQLAGIVELKGNPEEYKNKNDMVVHEPSSSGLKRSDTVKKAICQAYQANHGYPEVPFFIVSNSFPDKDTSPKKVLTMAEGDIVNLAVNIKETSEIEKMIQISRNSV